ncbi:DMT family transporter [Acidaminobacter hydrogenoformans]|uniref:Threonine/homoserine efflux transporter RhtA n=1 Tax=Acidaminobacter hydrogenoformans DSM 2784 TaxID=1120920 RepID=A0A1G5RX54_9FIRM|nr:DMT family transporter [Acidaminobacter hydrogenoformans]SCZ78623.1 Threonine/homoserine efflux transporter RhtA [Acidaminobacter hydrogenoformans DSM 2784]
MKNTEIEVTPVEPVEAAAADRSSSNKRGLLEAHFAVLLFGLAGLFGKWLTLHPMAISLGRVSFAVPFLLAVMGIRRERIRLKQRRDYVVFLMLGVVLAVHWTAFFMAIQLSTVAVGLLTFSTFPVFVTFLEPWLLKSAFRMQDVVVALITMLGVSLVVPDFSLSNQVTLGALWGVLSGLTFALLSVLNKKYVAEYPSRQVSLYQFAAAALVLAPVVIPLKPVLDFPALMLLAILGIIFTGIAHTLFISSMKRIKAQTASVIASLEPVYGILATVVLLGEVPGLREIMGGAVILSMAYWVSRRDLAA